MNRKQVGEEGDLPDVEAEDSMLRRSRAPSAADRTAFDLFYDREMDEQEKRRLIGAMAEAGDEQAIGYMGSFAPMDAFEMQTAATEVDAEVIEICAAVAERMTEGSLLGTKLRERKHLDPFIKDEIEARSQLRPVSRRYSAEAFLGLGPVDVVSDRPRVIMELKWSYELPGKVFESVWDAIKPALLGPAYGFEHLYIATGAAAAEWDRTESADLFETGCLDPLEIWQRPLEPPRGPNYGVTIGQDLVIGARGNQPVEGPKGIRVRALGSFPVAEDFELRLIAVGAITGLRTWPQIVA